MRVGSILSWCLSVMDEIDAEAVTDLEAEFNDGYKSALEDIILLIYQEAVEEGAELSPKQFH